jgi:hypothetical protein
MQKVGLFRDWPYIFLLITQYLFLRPKPRAVSIFFSLTCIPLISVSAYGSSLLSYLFQETLIDSFCPLIVMPFLPSRYHTLSRRQQGIYRLFAQNREQISHGGPFEIQY